MVYLIVPKIGPTPAGGSLYNYFVAKENNFLRLIEVLEVEDCINKLPENALVIVDSLILVSFCERGYNLKFRTIGLIHLPTFLDKKDQNKRLVAKELNYLKDLPLIVTGNAFKEDLIASYALKDNRIYPVLPGMSESLKKESYAQTVNKILVIASITRRKEILTCIKTLSELKSKSWSLTIFGEIVDREYFDEIQSYLKEKRLAHKVVFKGYVKQELLWQSLIKYDLMLNFSRYETFGMAIYEALQIGLPILSFGTVLDSLFSKNGNFKSFMDLSSFKRELEKLITDSNYYDRYKFAGNTRRDWKQVAEEFNNTVCQISKDNQW